MAPTLSPEETELLGKIPADGSSIGNIKLRAQLRWNVDKYWRVRDSLVDKEIIRLGRGKGGSVARIINVDSSILAPTAVSGDAGPTPSPEDALYAPLETVLRDKWCKELRFEEFVIQVTAKQGRRETGGKWTRPDIVVVSVMSYLNLPGKFVDVITFEVKTADGLDVSAVYEALAHLRAATRAYLIICVPADQRPTIEPSIEAVASEASRHGVGFIVVPEDVSKYDEWDFIVDATPIQGTASRIDEFLERQLSEENKRKLRRFIH